MTFAHFSVASERIAPNSAGVPPSTVPPNSFARRYALGFGGFSGWIGHTGELPGFNTSILYDPKTGTSMVAMVNSDIGAQVNGKPADPAPTITSAFVAALDG